MNVNHFLPNLDGMSMITQCISHYLEPLTRLNLDLKYLAVFYGSTKAHGLILLYHYFERILEGENGYAT